MTNWRALLREVCALEMAWQQRRHELTYRRADAVRFQPYCMPRFISLLTEAIMNAPEAPDGGPVRFLDVGCGPGAKVLVAREFGLEASGIDISPTLVAVARDHGADAHVADAYTYRSYHSFGIVFANQPSQDVKVFEPLLMEHLAPGTLLMTANWLRNPLDDGWQAVSVEEGAGPVAGVFRKPA